MPGNFLELGKKNKIGVGHRNKVLRSRIFKEKKSGLPHTECTEKRSNKIKVKGLEPDAGENRIALFKI